MPKEEPTKDDFNMDDFLNELRKDASKFGLELFLRKKEGLCPLCGGDMIVLRTASVTNSVFVATDTVSQCLGCKEITHGGSFQLINLDFYRTLEK